MTSIRLLFAMVMGAVVTFGLFIAVGALNEASAPLVKDTVRPNATTPIVVTQPPKARTIPPRAPTAVRTSAYRATAAMNRVRASVLPALSTANTRLGLGSSLPNIGDVGLGQVEVPEVITEPDRAARARKTVQPVYPITAQKNGTEGYVVLRLNVDVNGRVKDLIVVDSEPIGVFEKSARNAARRFEFVPARQGGKLVSTTVEKKIVFSLQ